MEQTIFQTIFEKHYPVFHKDFPDIVYHYSDCSCMLSIIEKKELWLSNILFMNDSQELEHSVTMIKKGIDSISKNKEIKAPLIKALVNLKKENCKKTFVLSLTHDPDSLNLWNNYSKNEGYNIGFDSKILYQKNKMYLKTKNNKENSDFKFLFGRVVYDEKQQEEIISDLFKTLVDEWGSIINNKTLNEKDQSIFLSEILRLVIGYSTFFKSDKHKIENEIRFIFEINNKKDIVYFRNRNGVVLPFIKIGFYDEKLPIKYINMGPKINDKIAREGIKALISSYDKKIRIKSSRMKLRF